MDTHGRRAATRWLALAALGAALTFALGFTVRATPALVSAEFRLNQALSDHQLPWLNAVTVALSDALTTSGNAVVLLLVFVVLWQSTRSWRWSLGVFLVATIDWSASTLVKRVVGMPRPDARQLSHPLAPVVGHDSFPSGHTSFIAACAVAAILIARGSRWERTVWGVGIAAVAVMGFTRMYVGAHYLSDVVGAVLTVASATALCLGVGALLWPRAQVARGTVARWRA